MSRLSRLAKWLPQCRCPLIATVLFTTCAASAAEIVDNAKAARTRPAPVESMARIPDGGPKTVLKCWQEGRLIFETAGVTIAENAAGAPAMKGPNGRSVHLLDLRQGLCILERTNG